MRKNSKARALNGAVSAAIVVFFLGHAVLGSLSALFGISSPFTWFVWIGVVLVGVHVAVSVVTSREQLNDPERPPSARRKRHLALKWVTGGLLLAVAAAHITSIRIWGANAVQSSVSGAALIAVLAVILAVHLNVGSKSLLKDLGIDRRYQLVFRIAVCVLAVFFVTAAIVGVVL